jgi:hypothetical protein
MGLAQHGVSPESSETVCQHGGLVWADLDAAGTGSDAAAKSGEYTAMFEAAGRRDQKHSNAAEEEAAAAAGRATGEHSNWQQDVRATTLRGSRAANASSTACRAMARNSAVQRSTEVGQDTPS